MEGTYLFSPQVHMSYCYSRVLRFTEVHCCSYSSDSYLINGVTKESRLFTEQGCWSRPPQNVARRSQGLTTKSNSRPEHY